MVSCEAPNLSRRAGNRGYRREEEEDEQERYEHAGCGVRASGGVYNVDDGIAGILQCGQHPSINVNIRG
jgi:hypothetical protein